VGGVAARGASHAGALNRRRAVRRACDGSRRGARAARRLGERDALTKGPAMALFWTHYKSEFTGFLDELKEKRPTLEAEQLEGFARLWEPSIDREAQKGWQSSRVRQQGYVYQTLPR
jgi:hypothetical protein